MRPGTVRPDIVVGIDFGMTCTGVAYSTAPEWARPTAIQHWPGKLGHENRNKVATKVAYDPKTNYATSWGFLIDETNPDLDVQTLFKLYLDPAYSDQFRDAPTAEEARKWFVDYLRYIYLSIKNHFDETSPHWQSKAIEFLFSVPTTWKNPAMIGQIEELLHKAGFAERSNHVVKISLTEAEAAAIYVSKNQYERGDVFLICDAGGGTTDVNVLKVTSSAVGSLGLEPLGYVEGEAIGSSIIDFKVENLIARRLEMIRDNLSTEPADLAERMIGDRFETFKCSFGSDAFQVLDLLLPIPGLEHGRDFPHASVRDSKMVITRQDLQKIFDDQIEKMFDLIDAQLHKLLIEYPRERVSYLTLSGGLGSSPYLKQRLRKRYELGASSLPNASELKILTALEPQLAVVQGLVMNRTQELSGPDIIVSRCSRNSYGVIVRAPYDPLAHMGEDIVIDPRDRGKWAERQIHWFIKQGQKVSTSEGIKNHYRMKIDLGKERVPWRTQIVMSSLPAAHLPKSMKWDGAKSICNVESIIDPADMKLKNRHWYNWGTQYHRADFDVKVLIGPADLKFQIWGKSGQLSKTHEEIEVQWSAGDAQPQHTVTAEDFGMYKY